MDQQLTKTEETTLITLLEKLTPPYPPEIFHAICQSFVTVAIELAVIRTRRNVKEIFLIERHDADFNGWHLPGSVILPSETVEDKVANLISSEVGDIVNTATFIRWFEFMKGEGANECARGQEFGLLYTLHISETVEIGKEIKNGIFVSLKETPSNIWQNILPHHKTIIEFLRTL